MSGGTLPGDPCPIAGCGGTIEVPNSHKTEDGTKQIRFLECSNCKHRPEDSKWIAERE
jgi:hypothetical protein